MLDLGIRSSCCGFCCSFEYEYLTDDTRAAATDEDVKYGWGQRAAIGFIAETCSIYLNYPSSSQPRASYTGSVYQFHAGLRPAHYATLKFRAIRDETSV